MNVSKVNISMNNILYIKNVMHMLIYLVRRMKYIYSIFVDSLIIDMCLTTREIKSQYGHFYLKTSSASCSCRISGSVARLKILQTAYVTVLIQSNESNIFGMIQFNVSLKHLPNHFISRN